MKKIISAALTALFVFNSSSFASLYSNGLDKNLYTTDFMMGSVVVAIVFPESDGSLDPSTENWTDERKSQALSKIIAGLDWWTKQNTRSPLTFTYVTKSVATKYEPITRPYYDEALWIPDVLSRLGYSGSRFTATRNFVNDLRRDNKTDWGFVIYVVDSLNDSDGKFADGLFAYSYLGGPYSVMTYDNDGYGIANMDVVTAHETGHIFSALDEYAGASSPNDYSNGYFPTKNGNHAFSAIANDSNSIMRGGIRWGLDEWARAMVGWRDLDKNNRDDILDQNPKVNLSSSIQAFGPGSKGFAGDAQVNVLARQGSATGLGLTLDTIAKVEFRFPNGTWATAVPTDGSFDSAQESFQIILPSNDSQSQSTISSQDVEIRVTTAYALKTGPSVTAGGGSSPTPTSLDDAHAFPNPFKPNSKLGHVNVTFTNLTPGAKVQIFTVSGEPVYEKSADPTATTLSWRAINDSGEALASGVYYYLISDSAGHKKKGKIAIAK